MRYIVISDGRVLFKNPPKAIIIDEKIYIFDAKQKVNIEAALSQGAKWRSTSDGLLLLISTDGKVILVTRRKDFGHSGKRGGGWGKSKHGYDREIEKIRNSIPTLKKFTEHAKKYAKDLKDDDNISDIEEKEFADKFKKLVDESDYAMRCKSTTLAKRLNSGFKNQIQVYEETGTLHSGGYKGPEKRKKWSQKMFGHDGTDGNGHELSGEKYEKYGFLTPKDMSIRPQAAQYGDVVVRFKKDHFKGRVTYTVGDSLSLIECAGDIEKPSMAGIGTWYPKATIHNIKDATDMKDFADRIHESYIELQYHGANPTIDDISSVTFMDDSAKLTKSTFNKLKKKGITVYLQNYRMSKPVEIKTEEDREFYFL